MNPLLPWILCTILMLCINIEGHIFKNYVSSHENMIHFASDPLDSKKLFLEIEKHTSKIKKSTHFAEFHLSKNRSEGFLPFDETRTCREIPDFYISASDISTPMQRYIIAQAPTVDTVLDFWEMILYKNCNLIVTACMPIESNRERCAPYWTKSYLPKKVLHWKLSKKSETVVAEGPMHQRIIERRFTAKNHDASQNRTIVQLHLENWPDYGTPDLDLFHTLLNIVDQYSYCSFAPILVHCSAGVGRSGTFVATHSLRKELFLGAPTINIPKRIYDLRLQRAHVVTSSKQFQFIYKTLLPYF